VSAPQLAAANMMDAMAKAARLTARQHPRWQPEEAALILGGGLADGETLLDG